ncbi:MAG: serine protease [Myxococcota bacterium]|jgi:serine protease
MGNRRLGLPVIGAVSLVIALACGGMGVEQVGGGSSKGDTKALKLGGAKIKKGQRSNRPSNKSVGGHAKKGEFVVKLRRGADSLSFPNGKTIKSGSRGLDSAFGSLSLTGAGKVHSKAAKDKRLASILGFDRTIHIKTKKPAVFVLEKLGNHPDVEWVEQVSKVKTAAMPNDPYFEHQWHMQNLDVTKAWETTKGKGVVVAVVDTGVSVGEDGFYKILQGYDFVDDDTKPEDGNGHGTHVAGTIGQKANNGVGVAGVAPEVTILPVRVLDDYGSGSNTWVASGIIWAADHGANVINLSLGSSMNSEVVADACAYAYEHGVTVIAATGNDGYSDFIGFPAALPTTIAVGSVDTRNEVAFYSNQGDEIDLVGPGGDTSSDMHGGVVQETKMDGQWGYFFLQGTSMATPHVSGVAALIYANGVKEPDAIREVLTSSAKDLGKGGWDTTYGAGVVDPVAALGTKGGNPGKSGGKIEIVAKRVKKLGDHRAMVEWLTSEPGSTMLRGGGQKEMEKHPVKAHRVTVEGQPGQTIEYEIGTQAGGKTAKSTVKVSF